MIMQYDVFSQRVIEKIEHIIKGYSLRLSIVNTQEYGIMLKVSLMSYGGYEVGFFTNSNYLVINRKICRNELVKLQVELPTYYGYDCDLTFIHTKNVFADFALFDVSKIWRDLGYTPQKVYNLAEIRKEISTWEK